MEKRVVYILLAFMLYDIQKARHSGHTLINLIHLQGAWGRGKAHNSSRKKL